MPMLFIICCHTREYKHSYVRDADQMSISLDPKKIHRTDLINIYYMQF